MKSSMISMALEFFNQHYGGFKLKVSFSVLTFSSFERVSRLVLSEISRQQTLAAKFKTPALFLTPQEQQTEKKD